MGICDFHSHLIPAVDDGAATIEDSRSAVATMIADGIARIITTPHFNAELTLYPWHMSARLKQLDDGWELLSALASAEFPDVPLGRGVELMLDVPDPDLTDSRLRLGGGDFLLVEFPGMAIPPNSAAAVGTLAEKGFHPIISHPERYNNMSGRTGIAKEWIDAGATLQVNYRSLTGDYGNDAKRNARQLLEAAQVGFFSSDFHGRGTPGIQKTRELFDSWNASALFVQLSETNPGEMFGGNLPSKVTPLPARTSLLSSLKNYFGAQ